MLYDIPPDLKFVTGAPLADLYVCAYFPQRHEFGSLALVRILLFRLEIFVDYTLKVRLYGF